jgi:hypothetical protein
MAILAGLLAEERCELRQEGTGDDLGAFGGGMNTVLLDGAGDVDQILVDHGNEGRVVFRGEIAENLVEGLDVVGAVVRRKGDAGEEHLDVRGFEGGEDRVKILLCLMGRQSPEPVVAAEFDDDDGGVGLDDCVYVGGCVLGGGAAGAPVFDLVFVAALVQIALERVWERLAGLEAISGGDTVAIADDERPFGSEQRKCRQYDQNRNEKPAANVHMNSVKLCKGRNRRPAEHVKMK